MNKSILVSVVAGCVIELDGKYLLVQERQPKAYGLWNLPAGHVDEGETLEAAAIREAHEETGYVVEIVSKIGVEHPEANRSVLHAYRAKIVSGELVANQDELLDAHWFNIDEIERLSTEGKLRNEWVLSSIKRA